MGAAALLMLYNDNLDLTMLFKNLIYSFDHDVKILNPKEQLPLVIKVPQDVDVVMEWASSPVIGETPKTSIF